MARAAADPELRDVASHALTVLGRVLKESDAMAKEEKATAAAVDKEVCFMLCVCLCVPVCLFGAFGCDSCSGPAITKALHTIITQDIQRALAEALAAAHAEADGPTLDHITALAASLMAGAVTDSGEWRAAALPYLVPSFIGDEAAAERPLRDFVAQ